MRYRPVWEAAGQRPNKIYHPIKTPQKMQIEERLGQIFQQQSHWGVDLYALTTLQPLLKDSYLPFTRFSLRPSSLSMILNDVIVNQRRTIIEFGSGVSTIVLARLIRQHEMEAKIISVEHSERWSGIMNKAIRREGLTHIVTLVHAPLAPCPIAGSLNDWYDMDRIGECIEGCQFDLVIVDGPPAYEKDKETARYPAIPFLFNRLTANAAVYLDDANREGEKRILEYWAEEYSLPFTILSGTLGYSHRGENFDPTY
jgi:predicted O-methyltransferase YrrM